MSKVYILQKDAPDAKAGTRYIQNLLPTNDWYFPDGDYRGRAYSPNDIENNTEWFTEEQTGKISVSGLSNTVLLSINAEYLSVIILKYIYVFLKKDTKIPSYKEVKEWVLENVKDAK